MYNRLIMVGNLTRDIELRYLPSGLALAKSSIATSNKYKTAAGEQKEEVCFVEFNVFGRSAEVLNQYVRKGSKVLLEGSLKLDQWIAQDGTKRSKHSMKVENFKFLDAKSDNVGNSGFNNNPQSQQQPPYNSGGGGYNQPSSQNYGGGHNNQGGGYNQPSSQNYGGGYNQNQNQGGYNQPSSQNYGGGYNNNQNQNQAGGYNQPPQQEVQFKPEVLPEIDIDSEQNVAIDTQDIGENKKTQPIKSETSPKPEVAPEIDLESDNIPF